MQDSVPRDLRWKLYAGIRKWLQMWAPNADARELERCGDDIRRIAADAGVDTDDLRRLVSRGENAAALLPNLMEVLNLDPAAVPIDVLRDLQRVCSFCKTKTECACELAHGSAAITYPEFCPNAQTLRALQQAMEQWPSAAGRAIN
jgi:hypothetical protein